MATVGPVLQASPSGVVAALWENLATGDTITEFSPNGTTTLAGSVQFAGTFGGATVTLEVSNDNTNWETLSDTLGSIITATSAAMFEFSTAALYIRPNISGGSSDAVDVTICLRG